MIHLDDERLDAIAEGAAPDAVASAHLSECAQCRHTLARLAQLRERLATLPRSVDVAGDGWPALRDRIRRRRQGRRAFGAAAITAIAAALLVAVVRMEGGDTPPATVSAEVLDELRDVAEPQVVEAVAVNLTVYDAALRELEADAAAADDEAEIRLRIAELRRKRAALLRFVPSS